MLCPSPIIQLFCSNCCELFYSENTHLWSQSMAYLHQLYTRACLVAITSHCSVLKAVRPAGEVQHCCVAASAPPVSKHPSWNATLQPSQPLDHPLVWRSAPASPPVVKTALLTCLQFLLVVYGPEDKINTMSSASYIICTCSILVRRKVRG